MRCTWLSSLSCLVIVASLIAPGAVLAQEGNTNCAVSAPEWDESKALYDGSCLQRRVDCDRVGGQWVCGSFKLGPRNPADPEPSAENSPSNCLFTDAEERYAISGFDRHCMMHHLADCDLINGAWTCASCKLGENPPTVIGSLGEPLPSCTSMTAGGTPGAGGSGSVKPGDLLALHFEHGFGSPTPPGMIASRMLTDRIGLRTHVVYYSTSRNWNDVLPQSPTPHELANTVWGFEGNSDSWWDANADPQRAVRAAADRWTSVIERGGHVWVLDIGRSDFTSPVVDELIARLGAARTRQSVTVVSSIRPTGNIPVPNNLLEFTDFQYSSSMVDTNFWSLHWSLPRGRESYEEMAKFVQMPVYGRMWQAALDADPLICQDFVEMQDYCHLNGLALRRLPVLLDMNTDVLDSWPGLRRYTTGLMPGEGVVHQLPREILQSPDNAPNQRRRGVRATVRPMSERPMSENGGRSILTTQPYR